MTAKEHLELYSKYKSEKLNLLSERDLIVIEEALPPGIDYSADRVQTSPSGDDGIVKKLIRIQTRTAYIDKRVEWLTDKMCIIKAEVNAVSGELSCLLWKRYIEGKTWVDLAAELGYSENHCKNDLHCQALREFEQILKHPPKST